MAQPNKTAPKKHRPKQPKIGGVRLMSWPVRGYLAGGTILGALAYGLVLTHFGGDSWVATNAANIQIAAALSWVVFGIILLVMTKARPSIEAWIDACLTTMIVGMCILVLAPVSEIISGGDVGDTAHIGLLVLANIAMAAVFLARASRLKLDFARGAALWFGVMNGLFAFVLIILGLIS